MTALWFLGVFLAAAVVAVPWAMYSMSAAAHRAFRAAGWDFVIYMIGPIGTVGLLHSRWCIPFSALGGATGTYFTIRRAKRRKESDAVLR